MPSRKTMPPDYPGEGLPQGYPDEEIDLGEMKKSWTALPGLMKALLGFLGVAGCVLVGIAGWELARAALAWLLG